jgi:protease-4
VKAGRGETLSDSVKLDNVADGSIFTAYEAISNGLVDQVGYLDDAIATAEKMSGISTGKAGVFILREPPSLFGNGLFGMNQAPRKTGNSDWMDGERVRTLLNELAAPRVAYLMH